MSQPQQEADPVGQSDKEVIAFSIVQLFCVSSGEVKLVMNHIYPHDVLEYRKDPLRKKSPKTIITTFGWAFQGNIGPVVYTKTVALDDDR
jgi:hypothetical protein